MATFIALIDFTEHGIQNVKETGKRADKFVELAKASGAKVRDIFWTMGSHDGVLIFDAPDGETAASLLLKLGSFGEVRTTTLQAFDHAQIDAIVSKSLKKSGKAKAVKKK